MSTTVNMTQTDSVATICFCAAGKPPTFDHAVLDALDGVLAKLEQDTSVRTVVVRSDSTKYFHVGADINALEQLNPDTADWWVRHGHAVLDRLESLTAPVIARVEGFALGGGLELALACDLIAATDTSKLGAPETRLGFVPGWGGTHRLPRRVGAAKAKELIFTGRIIDAHEAHRIGLVDTIGDAAAVDAWIVATIQHVMSGAAGAVAQCKRLLSTANTSVEKEAAATVVQLTDRETKHRVREFLETKRKVRS